MTHGILTHGTSTLRRRGAPDLSAPGRRVGEWHLVRRINEGPFTSVYQARPADFASSRSARYAIKLVEDPRADDEHAQGLLRREAYVGRGVCHAHLISVLAAHVTSPPYYFVMPWLAGATLARHLAVAALPDVPVGLWLVRQVAEALGALHAAGWMHADVKPANIMVSAQGHATLIDLGFARRPGESTSPAERFVMGTVQYMAPEVLTSSLRPDIRSDLYSLGITLFEVLTGRLPFAARDAVEVARQQCQDAPPDPRRIRASIPGPVAALIRQLLAKEPLRRPQTPSELVERLTNLEIDTFAERAPRDENEELPGLSATVKSG